MSLFRSQSKSLASEGKRHSISLIVALRAMARGTEFVGWAIIARKIGANNFGAVSVGFLICRYLGIIADWGASTRGSRDLIQHGIEHVYGLVRRREVNTFVLTITFAVGCDVVHKPTLIPLVAVLAAQGFNRDWISIGKEEPIRSSTPVILQGVTLLVGSFFTSSLTSGAIAVSIAYLVGFMSSVVLNPISSDLDKESKVSLDGWMMAGALADQLTVSLDTIILGILRSSREAGIYAAIYRIPNTWVFLIQTYVMAAVPQATRAFLVSTKNYSKLLSKSLYRGMFLAAVPLISVFFIKQFVSTLFGNSYSAGANPVIILLLATSVWSLLAPTLPLFLAIGKERAASIVIIGSAIFNAIVNLSVIPHWGMLGAAYATLATQVVSSSGMIGYLVHFKYKVEKK